MKIKNIVSNLRLRQMAWLLFITIILTFACRPNEPPPLLAENFPSPTATRIAIPSPSANSTDTPVVTPGVGSTNNSDLPLLEPTQYLTAEFTSEEFQDLIIFTSTLPGGAAFANFPINVIWAEGTESHLYAFSPDGQRAGTLTPPEFASISYLPSNPSEKPMLVEYGVEFNHPAIQGIELPQECYKPGQAGEQLIACGGFQFSPDGQYLGFFYGSPMCWRGIIIQDTETGEPAYHSTYPDGHFFSLLDNGKALIATGHCEGGNIAFHDLGKDRATPLGGEGTQLWNLDHSAFVVQVSSFAGIDTSLWGFNIETEQIFLEEPDKRQIDDHPVWTPDKHYLLYQHRTFARASDGFSPTAFDQARQIMLVDTQQGTEKVLLSDPHYDFHLGSCVNCAEWYGDWIQIRRVVFTPEPITGGDTMYSTKEFTCGMYAQNCASAVELYALNWKTGELKPWSEMVQADLLPDPSIAETSPGPAPSQQPIYERHDQYTLYAGPRENTFWVEWRYAGEGTKFFLSGPNLISKPIYEHPSGRYAFYVGIDEKSLWMVPEEGIPLPWVFNGQNYFYLGEN